MREKTKLVCFVLAAVVVCSSNGCASRMRTDAPPSSPAISADTRSKMEQEAARNQKADEENFDLLSIRMDEYQDTLALCERLPKGDEDSLIGTICREKLRKLKEEIEYLSSVLQRQP